MFHLYFFIGVFHAFYIIYKHRKLEERLYSEYSELP